MHLPARFFDEIVAHATEGQPNEVCGLIAGRDGRAVKMWRTTNSDPSPRIRYNVEPIELLNILREIESSGWTLMSIYHSHPATSAYPSATDIGLAYYPEAVYIITSLAERGQAEPVPGWRSSLLPFLAAPLWGATAVRLLSRIPRRRGGRGLKLYRARPALPRNRLMSLLDGPFGLAGLFLADIGLARLLNSTQRVCPVLRAFKIVNGKVVQEPLLQDHDPMPPDSIQRQPMKERIR